MSDRRTPDLMPVLSRGKHRNPRKGACFMEMTSYLAGEPWSDHPKCTHTLLAALARDVNDHVGDSARQQLAPMIPEVIGLDGDDPRVDAWIALTAARTALPISSAERQGVAAVGVLRCERVLDALEGRPLDYVSPESTTALAAAPHAMRWAQNFSRTGWGSMRSFRKRSAPSIVHTAVVGIAEACIDDAEMVLVDLLRRTIANCHGWFGPALPADSVGPAPLTPQLRASSPSAWAAGP